METKTLYLKPVEGRVVRDPQGGEPLPASGKAVPDTSYWRRRLKDGDAEKTTAQAIAKAVAKKEG